MKLLKLLAAGVLAVSFAGTASAQTKVYVTGSTAFRAATINAISAMLTGTVTTASDKTPITSANAVTFTGGSVSGTPVTVKCSWSGSSAGIQTVGGNAAAAFTVRFLPDGATGNSNADPRTVGNPAEVIRPDVAMADNLQASTLWNGTFSGKTYLTLTDTQVGVVPFTWVASNGFPASSTMTPGLAQYLYGSGAIPLAIWTGNHAHETVIVYAGGRDPDSGTRINTFAESGIGVFANVNQYKPTMSGGTISSLQLFPAETINGVSVPVGNGGESSGGSLAGYCNNVLSAAAYQNASSTATGGYMMVYLGISDANTALGGTPAGVQVAWNGIPYSITAVEEGSYTFWGYEHLMYRSNLGDGTTDGGPAIKKTFANSLVTQITGETTTQLSPAGISLNDMQVQRAQEGAIVGALYF